MNRFRFCIVYMICIAALASPLYLTVTSTTNTLMGLPITLIWTVFWLVLVIIALAILYRVETDDR